MVTTLPVPGMAGELADDAAELATLDALLDACEADDELAELEAELDAACCEQADNATMAASAATANSTLMNLVRLIANTSWV